MASRVPERLGWQGHLGLLRDAPKIRLPNLQDTSFKTHAALVGIALMLGAILGGLLVHVPPLYLMFGIGALVFAFLLLFKIEVAIILALLLRNYLGRYNYLGGDTAIHPNGLLGVAIIGGAIFFFLFHKIDFHRLRAIGPFLGFVVVCLITLVPSGEHFMSRLAVTLRLATALAMYAVLLYRLDSMRMVNWVFAAVIVAAIWPTAEGLLSVAGATGLTFNKAETARLGHSGVGAYLALILTPCLVFFLNAKTNSRRLLWGGLTGLFGAGLFFSFGRAGWIAFVVAVIVIALMSHRKLLVILPVLLVLLIVLVPAVSQRFSDIDPSELDNSRSSTLAGRFVVWEVAAKLFKTHPLLGMGYGAESYGVGEYLGKGQSIIHNDYLMVLLSTGLVGFTLFILWQGQWLVEILRVFRVSRHEIDRMMALAVFAVFVVSLVIRVTDNVLQSTDKLYSITALTAAILVLPRIRTEEEAKEPTTVSPVQGVSSANNQVMPAQDER
jgi:O-antigen ligase